MNLSTSAHILFVETSSSDCFSRGEGQGPEYISSARSGSIPTGSGRLSEETG